MPRFIGWDLRRSDVSSYWFGWRAAACVAAAAAYELLVASGNPGLGWGLPARYPMIVIPLIAIPIALLIQQVRAARFLFVPLLAVSFVFAAVAMNDFQGLYPVGDKPRMFGLRTTAAAFPMLGHEPPADSFALIPSSGAAPDRPAKRPGNSSRKRGATDRATCSGGRTVPLRAGTYRASFPLGITGTWPTKSLSRGSRRSAARRRRVFASKVLTAGEIRSHGRQPVILEFNTPGEYLVETRLYYDGRGDTHSGPGECRGGPDVPAPARLSSRTLDVLWIGGTIVVGWIFVLLMRRSRRRSRRRSGRKRAAA